MKTLIYTRVSTKEQADEGYSLEAQEKLLKEYAETHNLVVDKKIFKISESASGKHLRKLFNEVFDYAEQAKVSIILCEKIDRLTRNSKDAVVADDWVKAVEGREIHFVKESFILNSTTRAHENLVWDMKVSIARFYSNNLSEEVKKGHKEKVSQGWYPSKAPLGYKSTGEKGHKTHILDPVKAPLVRKMFEYYSTRQYSLSALVEKMHDEGLRTYAGNKLVKSRMASLLSDPFYFGDILWNGKIYPGKQEPLITRELYNRVQDVLHGRTVPRHNKHLFTFKGFIRCDNCGGLVTWETKKGHIYGHCNKYNNCPVSARYTESVLQLQFLPAFARFKISNPRLLDWVKKALLESHKGDIEYSASALTELQKQIAVVQNRLDRLYDDKLDQKITEDMYQRKFEQYTNEKNIALQGIAKYSGVKDEYQELGSLLQDLSQRGEELFQKASVVQKRKIINFMLTNISIQNRLISYEYTKPFQVFLGITKFTQIVEARQLTDELLKSFDPITFYKEKFTIELANTGLDKKKNTAFEAVRSVWLDTCREVRTKIIERISLV
jgi:DNA invertase Pin-like site-specific DNA recombinase